MGTPAPARPRPRLATGSDERLVAVLVLVVGLSRGLLLGSHFGEPDSARFTIGVWHWIHGPHAAPIYDERLAAGYYWLTGHLATGVALSHLPLCLARISATAALLSAVFLWSVARQLLSRTAAFWSSLLLLLSPGWWWLGLEPHPQELALALWLISLWAWIRANGSARSWWFAANAAAIAALLVRNDMGLLFGAYPATLWLKRRRDGAPRVRPREWLNAALFCALAIAVTLALRQLILGETWSRSHREQWLRTQGYLLHGLALLSHTHYLATQLFPMFTAPGTVAMILALAGIACGWRRHGHRWLRDWGVVILAWSAPGYIFWFLILGNNARHVIALAVPIFWAGWTGWERARWPARSSGLAAGIAMAALAIGLWAPPARADLMLWPSPNVPQSAMILHSRQRQIRAATTRFLAVSAPPACVINTALVNPYIEFDLLALHNPSQRDVRPSDHPILRVRVIDAYSPAQYRRAAAGCRSVLSFDFGADGRERQFLR